MTSYCGRCSGYVSQAQVHTHARSFITHTLTCSFTHTLTHSFTHTYTHTHSLTPLLTPSLTHSPLRRSRSPLGSLNVTKYVHLCYGDDGVRRMFKALCQLLKSGGRLILQFQQWAAYQHDRDKLPLYWHNATCITLRPAAFPKSVQFSNLQLGKGEGARDGGKKGRGRGKLQKKAGAVVRHWIPPFSPANVSDLCLQGTAGPRAAAGSTALCA